MVWFHHILHLFFADISPKTLLLIHDAARKAAHFTEFFVLALLFYRAFRQDHQAPWPWRWKIASWGLSMALSLLDEFHQLSVPGRTGSLRDIWIDSAGALVGVLFFFLLAAFRAKASPAVAAQSAREE